MSLSSVILRFPLEIFNMLNTLRTGDADLRFKHGETWYICKFSLVPLHKGNVSRGITPSSTTRVFDEYFLKISVHKSS